MINLSESWWDTVYFFSSCLISLNLRVRLEDYKGLFSIGNLASLPRPDPVPKITMGTRNKPSWMDFQVHRQVLYDTAAIWYNLERFWPQQWYFVQAMTSFSNVPVKRCGGDILGINQAVERGRNAAMSWDQVGRFFSRCPMAIIHHIVLATTQAINHRFRNLFCRVWVFRFD